MIHFSDLWNKRAIGISHGNPQVTCWAPRHVGSGTVPHTASSSVPTDPYASGRRTAVVVGMAQWGILRCISGENSRKIMKMINHQQIWFGSVLKCKTLRFKIIKGFLSFCSWETQWLLRYRKFKKHPRRKPPFWTGTPHFGLVNQGCIGPKLTWSTLTTSSEGLT